MKSVLCLAHADVDQRTARDAAEGVAVGEGQFQRATGDEGVFAAEAFGARALAGGNGLDDGAVMLVGDGHDLVRAWQYRRWKDHRAR